MREDVARGCYTVVIRLRSDLIPVVDWDAFPCQFQPFPRLISVPDTRCPICSTTNTQDGFIVWLTHSLAIWNVTIFFTVDNHSFPFIIRSFWKILREKKTLDTHSRTRTTLSFLLCWIVYIRCKIKPTCSWYKQPCKYPLILKFIYHYDDKKYTSIVKNIWLR